VVITGVVPLPDGAGYIFITREVLEGIINLTNMKATLKKVNDSYLLELDHYPRTVEVDGKRIKEFKNGWMDHKPKVVSLVETKSRIVSYGLLSVDEYKNRLEELVKEKDDDGYPVFANLDDEYAYKKFLELYPAQYEQYEDVQELEVIEYDITGKTDNRFIIPFRFIGGEVNKDATILYQYNAQPYKLAQLIASELGLEEVADDTVWSGKSNTKGMKWSCPSHSRSGLEYTKVNGNYAGYEGLKFYSISCGSYDECLKRYEEHYGVIRTMFEREIKKLKAEGLNYDKAKVLKELESIIALVRKIDAKRNSEIQPHVVSTRLQKFIDKL
jgi:hypothetical protein